MSKRRKKKNIHYVMRRGKRVLELRFLWPDGKAYRRDMPNETVAEDILAKRRVAVKEGTDAWQQLRRQLTNPKPDSSEGNITIEQLSAIYYDRWCPRYKSQKTFYKKECKHITRLVGDLWLQEFDRDDGNFLREERLSEGCNGCTVNHTLTVMSGMLKYAFEERKWLEFHPMANFKWERVSRKKRIPLDILEVRRMVQEAMKIDDLAGRCIGIIGQTALRRSEALNLKRFFVDVRGEQIMIEPSKHDLEGRYIPLSPEALELLAGLPGWTTDSEYLFVRSNGKRLTQDRLIEVMEQARIAAGMKWSPRPHDLRHYRCLMWLETKNDIDKVRAWMGHKSVETTQIYWNYVRERASAQFKAGVQNEEEYLQRRLVEDALKEAEK